MYDNCILDDASITQTDAGTINGCEKAGSVERGRSKTNRGKCIKQYDAEDLCQTQIDFEVVFPEDKTVTCDFLNRTDTAHAGRPIITDDECEQIMYDTMIKSLP